jgi:hypothetical protein
MGLGLKNAEIGIDKGISKVLRVENVVTPLGK